MSSKVIKSAMKRLSGAGRTAGTAPGTQMTSQEWSAHQVGMDEKWPLPEYMKGEKGHTAYRDDTYAIITHWAANTKISYRMHAKRPGSKSHVRYEDYSKAKTVGQALALGSLPADWCWDYERGFIKVHGPIRDMPVDISKEDDTHTDVDVAIHRWYRKELARNLGLNVKDLSVGKGSDENLVMRAHRLVSQRDAMQILEKADKAGSCITDADMEHILKKWHFGRNPNRINVMPEGQNYVFSDTLGMNKDRIGDIHLTPATKRYPQVTELMSRWLTERLPAEAKNFYFTSLNVNYNYAARQHRDNGNFGPSFIKAFGSFKGGQLNYWPEDDKSLKLEQLPAAGKMSFSLKDGLALFNGNCAHSVDDFEGHRYSIVFFTLGCHANAPEESKQQLRDLGLPYPPEAADRYQLLRPPSGNCTGRGAQPKGQSFRYWRLSALKPKKLPKRQVCRGKVLKDVVHKAMKAKKTIAKKQQ